ncbi:MAG: tripartite tricarboxylate transporter TctB family protein [Treponemataceae bacterium]
MKVQNMPRADFVMSIFLFVFGSAVTVLSLMMPRLESQKVSPYSVPGLVPGFLGVVIALLGLTMFVRSVRAGGYSLGIGKRAISEFLNGIETRRILLTIFLGAAYALGLLGRIHFMLATGIFTFAFVLVFEYKFKESVSTQWKTLFFGAILACVTSVSVYAVFAYLFLVNLP